MIVDAAADVVEIPKRIGSPCKFLVLLPPPPPLIVAFPLPPDGTTANELVGAYETVVVKPDDKLIEDNVDVDDDAGVDAAVDKDKTVVPPPPPPLVVMGS